MNQNIKNLFFLTITLLILILVFYYRLVVIESTINASYLWFYKIFPTLFITFILQDILINYNLAYYLNIIFGKLFKKILKVSSSGFLAFTLSLIGGSPSSAYVIKELTLKENITLEEGNRLLVFTHFANPLFLYTMLMLIFNNQILSIKLIVITYITNILLALVYPKTIIIDNNKLEKTSINFGTLLVNSIKKSMNNLITILGAVTFFMIIGSIVNEFDINEILMTYISGILEITAGLQNTYTLNTSLEIKKIITIAIISFGGFSIHAQVYSMIYETKLKYTSYLKGRIFSVIIGIFLVIILT